MFTKFFPISHGSSLVAAAVAAVAFAGLVGTASANMIVNGDFSANASSYYGTPGFSTTPYQTQPYGPTGWTIGQVQIGVNGPDTGFYSSDGEPFAPPTVTGVRDFGFIQEASWRGPNTISQTVATTAGSSYQLSYVGAASTYTSGNGGGYVYVLEVIVTDTTKNAEIVTQNPAITTADFLPFTLDFTATSASTNIEFLNGSTVGSGLSVDVSNVSLVALPEPATLGLMAVGGLGLLILGKRRKMA
ncbi:MAG: PEP-CTERM sorting domain-containing protein [Phycisphaerae bacterium]|nr:PEP-CTERM sorting domain-containing protein [Phycisphaerae bacterium]